MISRVVEDSAAAEAGLAVGDIITEVEGTSITSSGALGRTIRDREEGESVTIEFWRQGNARSTNANLKTHERCAFDVSSVMDEIDLEELSQLGVGISEEVLKGLQEAFEGQDWAEAFEGLEELNFESLEGLEERMERVQERLERLEMELEEEHKHFERESERLRERSRDRRERAEQKERREETERRLPV